MRGLATRRASSDLVTEDLAIKERTEPLLSASNNFYAASAAAAESNRRASAANAAAHDAGMSPEERAGLWSTLTFAWLNGTVDRGFKARLEPADALQVPTAFDHRTCLAAFQRAWRAHASCQGHGQVYRATLDVCGSLLGRGMALVFVSVALELANVFLVNRLIAYVESQDLSASSDDISNDDDGSDSSSRAKPLADGLLWASALGASLAANALIRAHAMYWVKLVGIVMRNVVLAAIFDKVGWCFFCLATFLDFFLATRRDLLGVYLSVSKV
jgi:hypothetical protein